MSGRGGWKNVNEERGGTAEEGRSGVERVHSRERVEEDALREW